MASGGSAAQDVKTTTGSGNAGQDSNVVRVGVIGYGYWGPNIVRNLSALDGCRVVTLCDQRPAALARST